MYENLRSQNVLSYDVVEKMFEDHQDKWPEAIFNEDSMFKYIDPLIEEGTGTYLAMLQGSKEEQRKWWLSNRFKYLDSKYNAGSAASDVIQLRGYAKSNITVKPYADIYASIKYGSYLQQTRANRGQEYTIVCPLDNVNDTEIYIYSASQLASIGDVSGLKVGLADFSKATRLQDVKVGDADSNYTNENLGAGKNALTFGNNTLLKTIDARNCINLGTGDQKSIDISHCSNIEEVYFDGTKIQGIQLPNGGVLRKLHLPATITNLTILNQKKLTEFVLPSYENISSLRLENNSDLLDTKAILKLIPENTRVRIIGFYWECENADEIDDIIATLNKMRGLDEQGNNMDTAQVSGTIHTSSLTGDRLAYYKEHYPYLNVTADHTVSTLRYYNYNGTVLIHEETIYDGGNGTYNESVARDADAQYTYRFAGWSKNRDSASADATAKIAVVADRNIYAAYSKTIQKYTVTFVNGSTVLQTNTDVPYGSSVTYTGTTPTYTGTDAGEFEFTGWNPDPSFITGNTQCVAIFMDMSTNLYKYLQNRPFDYESDTLKTIVPYTFSEKNINSFKAPLTTIPEYAFRDAKIQTIDLTSNDQITFDQNIIHGCSKLKSFIIRNNNSLPLITGNPFYNSSLSAWTAPIYVASDLIQLYRDNEYFGKYLILPIDRYPTDDYSTIEDSWEEIFENEANGTYSTKYSIGDAKSVIINGERVLMVIVAIDTDELADGSGSAKITWLSRNQIAKHRMNADKTTVGGWPETEMRSWLTNEILPTIDSVVRDQIKLVKKTSYIYETGETVTSNDSIWIPSAREFGGFNKESSGIQYYPDSKFKNVFTSLNSSILSRSASSATNFMTFNSVNSSSTASADSASYGVMIGFCT